jgi:hypothetical protein
VALVSKDYGIEYIICFFIASSFMFSNVNFDGFNLNNIFAIISVILSLLIFSLTSFLYLIAIAFLILISTLPHANNSSYFIAFIYKLFTLFPVIILVRRRAYFSCYQASLHSFILSNLIAIAYLVINRGSNHTFIIYYDVIPRYAALAKEPSSYAMFAFGLYLLSFFSNSLFYFKKSLLWYIPMIISVSSVFVFKVISDLFWKFKKRIYFNWVFLILPFSIFFFYIWNYTRISQSVLTRLNGYLGLLKGTEFIFFGSGIYQLYGFSDGLPGLFRVYYELGFVFSLFLFLLIILKIYTLRLWRMPLLYLALLYPFLTEAYGAQFMWLLFGFALTYKGNISHIKN